MCFTAFHFHMFVTFSGGGGGDMSYPITLYVYLWKEHNIKMVLSIYHLNLVIKAKNAYFDKNYKQMKIFFGSLWFQTDKNVT